MSFFDELVREALKNTPDLGLLQPVVEKELLHHDILREMSAAGVLADLVFMGGTCLRTCYGSARLSEDLDFYGGIDFHHEQLDSFPAHLQSVLQAKYGLRVEVRGPKITSGNVDTWKVSVVTRPERPHLPAQHIHLDICSLPAHDPQPMVLRNPYGVEMGTTGLIVRAATREEILADKWCAFALRRGRVKYRDLWDMQWLRQNAVPLGVGLVREKATDHGQSPGDFGCALRTRLQELDTHPGMRREFLNELGRFLSADQVQGRIDEPIFWEYLRRSLNEQSSMLLGGWA